MGIDKQPFVNYTLDEDKQQDKSEVITIRINTEWRKMLNEDKAILEQQKDGTAIKQLIYLGHIVLHDGLTGKILEAVFENKRKNKRLGVIDFE